jgi:hypothetical protein
MSGVGPTDMSPEDWRAEVFAAARKFCEGLMDGCFTSRGWSLKIEIKEETVSKYYNPPVTFIKFVAIFSPRDPAIHRIVRFNATPIFSQGESRVYSSLFYISATDKLLDGPDRGDDYFTLERYYARILGREDLRNKFSGIVDSKNNYWESPEECFSRILPLRLLHLMAVCGHAWKERTGMICRHTECFILACIAGNNSGHMRHLGLQLSSISKRRQYGNYFAVTKNGMDGFLGPRFQLPLGI